ncbi:MAG: DUF2284 domain-containing protein [Duncaniella sp.]|nr:DUF2284 domain-containing protein [Duncaniella sp.]
MENTAMDYTVQEFTVTLPGEDYIKRFRNAGLIMQRCMECDNYGCSWTCPPFDHDIENELRQYSNVSLTAIKMIPGRKDIPISEVFGFMRPERMRIDRRMLEIERRHGGKYLAFSGKCMYCPEGRCVRSAGLPCRHPDLVRPSLEAYGFDVARTVSELFGFDILWSSDGFLPEYITIVTGLFHNNDSMNIIGS